MIKKDIEFSNSFSLIKGEWVGDEVTEGALSGSNQLTAATFNVLNNVKSKILELILRSEARFDYQLKEVFPKLNSDIICLNEITPLFYDKLLLSEWANAGGLHFSFTGITGNAHENLVISRFPFKILHIPGNSRRIVFTLFQNNEKSFLVISVHLVAFEELFRYRDSQIKLIRKILSDLKAIAELSNLSDLGHAIANNNIILLGDLNLHHSFETNYIYDNDLIDTWLEIRPNNIGYTWDPLINSLIGKFLIFDNRRMRLDRICIASESKNIEVTEISQFANQKINGYLSLFPSDHFGLIAKIEIKKKATSYNEKYIHKPQSLTRSSVSHSGFRSMNTIKLMRATLVGAMMIFSFIIFYILVKIGIGLK
jgi:endonuclease/exonuclease/phosphatase family metal-dependent hydrolase